MCKASPIDPPSDHYVNPQSTTSTKRGHSALEALVRKVPVPKCKIPAGKQENNEPLASQHEEQLEEQSRGQTSATDVGKSNSILPSQVANPPFASTLEHDALPLTEDNVPPTQIDTEPASDTCYTSQEETLRLLSDSQGEVFQGDCLMNTSIKENKPKEAIAIKIVKMQKLSLIHI